MAAVERSSICVAPDFLDTPSDVRLVDFYRIAIQASVVPELPWDAVNVEVVSLLEEAHPLHSQHQVLRVVRCLI
jgi:hypothetical protein